MITKNGTKNGLDGFLSHEMQISEMLNVKYFGGQN